MVFDTEIKVSSVLLGCMNTCMILSPIMLEQVSWLPTDPATSDYDFHSKEAEQSTRSSAVNFMKRLWMITRLCCYKLYGDAVLDIRAVYLHNIKMLTEVRNLLSESPPEKENPVVGC